MYQKIDVKIWRDEKFVNLSEDARILFLYILTSPHSNSLGLYVLPEGYILADLQWDLKRLGKPLEELLENDLIDYDDTVRLVFVKNQLKHRPLVNQNQVTGALNILKDLPKSPLFSGLRERLDKPLYKPLMELLDKPFSKPIDINTNIDIDTNKKEKIKEGHELGKESSSTPPIKFNYSKKDFENISDDDMKAWQEAYPDVDIAGELSRIKLWAIANPQKVKPRQAKGKRGLRATLTNWFSREQEKYNSSLNLQKSKNEVNGEYAGVTYTDEEAFKEAQARGETNIRFRRGNYV